jgi:N-acetylmuramoyl-L-alanine amidase
MAWAPTAALSLSLALSATPGHAMTVTGATSYWTTTLQAYDAHTPGYSSRVDAATGGVTHWCSLPGNKGYFLSCSYGGIDSRDYAIAKTEYGNLAIGTVYQYPVCPVATQLYPTWTYNGITYTPACVNWSEPPPPPPAPPKPVVIDPGHGFNCALTRLPLGAVGVTDFLPTNPPPGRLQEDALAWAVAKEVQRQLPVSKYKVVLTKSSANACPGYRERGRWAIQERAKAFISIHMNAPNVMLGVEIPFANGTSVIYNSGSPGAVKLAEALARSVSSSLGINNRGVKVNNGLTVLQPDVTPVNAVLLEAARLSGRDELILHERDSAARIAAAIKATLDAELQD